MKFHWQYVLTLIMDQPLLFAALASQKNHMAVYLSGIYSSNVLREKFIADYKETGKRMDLGKSCVRFKNIEDLPLDLIGQAISALDVQEFIELYNISRSNSAKNQKIVFNLFLINNILV